MNTAQAWLPSRYAGELLSLTGITPKQQAKYLQGFRTRNNLTPGKEQDRFIRHCHQQHRYWIQEESRAVEKAVANSLIGGGAPAEQCRSSGLDGLTELSKLTGTSLQTLHNWHKHKPVLFRAVLVGAVAIK